MLKFLQLVRETVHKIFLKNWTKSDERKRRDNPFIFIPRSIILKKKVQKTKKREMKEKKKRKERERWLSSDLLGKVPPNAITAHTKNTRVFVQIAGGGKGLRAWVLYITPCNVSNFFCLYLSAKKYYSLKLNVFKIL